MVPEPFALEIWTFSTSSTYDVLRPFRRIFRAPSNRTSSPRWEPSMMKSSSSSRAGGWRGRRESDSHVFCHRDSMHACSGMDKHTSFPSCLNHHNHNHNHNTQPQHATTTRNHNTQPQNQQPTTSTSNNNNRRLPQACPFLLCHLLSMDPSGRPSRSAAQRRREQRHERMTVAMALAESTHHSSRGQTNARARVWGRETSYTATVRDPPTPQPELFSLYEEEPSGGAAGPAVCRVRTASTGTAAHRAADLRLRPFADSSAADGGTAARRPLVLRHVHT